MSYIVLFVFSMEVTSQIAAHCGNLWAECGLCTGHRSLHWSTTELEKPKLLALF